MISFEITPDLIQKSRNIVSNLYRQQQEHLVPNECVIAQGLKQYGLHPTVLWGITDIILPGGERVTVKNSSDVTQVISLFDEEMDEDIIGRRVSFDIPNLK